MSSFREGAVYSVDRQGEARVVVSDDRLCSVLGIALDAKRGRLWAVNADFATSLNRRSLAGPKKLAAVGVYDLLSGKPLQCIDLSITSRPATLRTQLLPVSPAHSKMWRSTRSFHCGRWHCARVGWQ